MCKEVLNLRLISLTLQQSPCMRRVLHAIVLTAVQLGHIECIVHAPVARYTEPVCIDAYCLGTLVTVRCFSYRLAQMLQESYACLHTAFSVVCRLHHLPCQRNLCNELFHTELGECCCKILLVKFQQLLLFLNKGVSQMHCLRA